MKTKSQLSCYPVLGAALVLLSSGCAYHHACEGHDFHPSDCYATWPCFGYHSTCWRPWPGECLTCPSPFLPGELPAESPKTELMPVPSEPALPVPMPEGVDPNVPPMPGVQEPAAPAPGVPQPGESLPQGALREESSSRRRGNVEQAIEVRPIHLESLRWAPTDNR